MKPFNVIAALSRHRPTTFKISYSPDYKTFILHHVLADHTHPLYETQKRRQRERPQDGLWWHVTTGVDLSKSSCVRAWARRRLRNAFVEELKLRGYDDAGKPLPVEQPKPATKAIPDLTGSLRMHVQAELIPAKFPVLRQETGVLIDLMLRAANNPLGSVPDRNPAQNTRSTSRASNKPQGSKTPSTKPQGSKAASTKPHGNRTTPTSPPSLSPRKTARAPPSELRFKRIVPGS